MINYELKKNIFFIFIIKFNLFLTKGSGTVNAFLKNMTHDNYNTFLNDLNIIHFKNIS